jgi:hypothetical protein
MGSLNFDEAGIKGAGTNCLNYGKYLEELLAGYSAILSDVCNRGIKSGAVHQALSILQQLVASPNGFQQLGANIARDTEDFVADIDLADEYIY